MLDIVQKPSTHNARFEVITVVLLKIKVFWDMAVYHLERLDPEDEDTMLLQRVGNNTLNNTASFSRRLESSSYPQFSMVSCSS
jgi:hypothetical protein